jgi:hypothetical protein
MDIRKSTLVYLRDSNQPVISDYDVCRFIFKLFQKQRFRKQAEKIKTRSKFPSAKTIDTIINEITEIGILAVHKDFPPRRVFQIIASKNFDVGDIACSVDPFCYVSHLSAMSFHGLTDRIPNILFISSPAPSEWKQYALKRMKNDLKSNFNDYINLGLPSLVRLGFSRLGKYPVVRYSTSHHGAYKLIEGRKQRVSTIGRTFLDMLREAGYCGGMRHVVDVYKEFAPAYKNLIFDEIDRHGNLIERTRAGYILEELCGITDNIINKWAKNIQRGGSRKLDPSGPYSATYSERWALSTNLD